MRNIGTLAAEADTPGPIGRRPSISCCCASRSVEASGWVQVRDLIVIGDDMLGNLRKYVVLIFGTAGDLQKFRGSCNSKLPVTEELVSYVYVSSTNHRR